MKKIISVLAVLLVSTASLFAETKVEFSGEAAVDFGYVSTSADGADTETSYAFPAKDTGVLLNAGITSGKLSGDFALEVDASGVAVDTAALTYNFGPAAVTYDAASIGYKWNDDGIFVDGPADGQSVTVSALSIAYVSVITLSPAGDYQSTDVLPVFSAGVEGTFGPADVAAGLVYDSDAAGYLAFLNSGASFGDLSAVLSVVYGGACGSLLGDDAIGEDSTILSVLVDLSYGLGAITPGVEVAFASKDIDGDGAYTAYSVNPYVAYAVDDNFGVTLSFDYDSESAVADDDGVDPTTTMTTSLTAAYAF